MAVFILYFLLSDFLWVGAQEIGCPGNCNCCHNGQCFDPSFCENGGFSSTVSWVAAGVGAFVVMACLGLSVYLLKQRKYKNALPRLVPDGQAIPGVALDICTAPVNTPDLTEPCPSEIGSQDPAPHDETGAPVEEDRFGPLVEEPRPPGRRLSRSESRAESQYQLRPQYRPPPPQPRTSAVIY
eukprot:TRINITY_DN616_c0_g1_i1.p1 TRINITY_DN616_c0_g1~~TRINITY_DN616_c0_g1_i1.p1  ORF type:complete len:191 (-),score=1.43 TRINITY_DN616_c0_g1_i1:306-854(-)